LEQQLGVLLAPLGLAAVSADPVLDGFVLVLCEGDNVGLLAELCESIVFMLLLDLGPMFEDWSLLWPGWMVKVAECPLVYLKFLVLVDLVEHLLELLLSPLLVIDIIAVFLLFVFIFLFIFILILQLENLLGRHEGEDLP
jgi:hypothetical protein